MFKLGDKVIGIGTHTSDLYGTILFQDKLGEVVCVKKGHKYEVIVQFEDTYETRSFTSEGRLIDGYEPSIKLNK